MNITQIAAIPRTRASIYRHQRFSSPTEFTSELDTYIHWYNNVRIREKLQGLSPLHYRAQFGQSAAPALVDNRTADGCT